MEANSFLQMLGNSLGQHLLRRRNEFFLRLFSIFTVITAVTVVILLISSVRTGNTVAKLVVLLTIIAITLLVINLLRRFSAFWAKILLLLTPKLEPCSIALVAQRIRGKQEIHACTSVLWLLIQELKREMESNRQGSNPTDRTVAVFTNIWDKLCRSSILFSWALADDASKPDLLSLEGKVEEQRLSALISEVNGLFNEAYTRSQDLGVTIEELYEKVRALSQEFTRVLILRVTKTEPKISAEEIIAVIEKHLKTIGQAIKDNDCRVLCEQTRLVLVLATILDSFFRKALIRAGLLNRIMDLFKQTSDFVSDPLRCANCIRVEPACVLYRRNIKLRTEELSLLGKESSVKRLVRTEPDYIEKVSQAEIDREVRSIFRTVAEEVLEHEAEKQFARNLLECIRRYEGNAVNEIQRLILKEEVKPDSAETALRILGDIDHKPTYDYRRWLLEKALINCSSPIVRDGANVGLSYMDDPHAIPFLKKAIQNEENLLLLKGMEKTLIQLEDTQACLSCSEVQNTISG